MQSTHDAPGGITVTETGMIHADGPQGVNTYRMLAIRSGLGLEVKTGMRLSRGASASQVATSILKEAGIVKEGKRPNKTTVYRLFDEYLTSLGYQPRPL
jgi:hypothetical protein